MTSSDGLTKALQCAAGGARQESRRPRRPRRRRAHLDRRLPRDLHRPLRPPGAERSRRPSTSTCAAHGQRPVAIEGMTRGQWVLDGLRATSSSTSSTSRCASSTISNGCGSTPRACSSPSPCAAKPWASAARPPRSERRGLVRAAADHPPRGASRRRSIGVGYLLHLNPESVTVHFTPTSAWQGRCRSCCSSAFLAGAAADVRGLADPREPHGRRPAGAPSASRAGNAASRSARSRASAFAWLGELDKARTSLAKALRDGPDDLSAFLMFARTYLDEGDFRARPHRARGRARSARPGSEAPALLGRGAARARRCRRRDRDPRARAPRRPCEPARVDRAPRRLHLARRAGATPAACRRRCSWSSTIRPRAPTASARSSACATRARSRSPTRPRASPSCARSCARIPTSSRRR